MNDTKAIETPKNVCFNCLQEKAVHSIVIPMLGFGSEFDGFSSKIQLCDDCIKQTNPEWWKLEVVKDRTNPYIMQYKYEDEILNFVNQMPVAGQELFWNRYAYGATISYMQPQDWIDYKLNILPHEKCKEYGLYSPQEIQAYKERFPKCQHVINRVFSDVSIGSWCPFGAYGEFEQRTGVNICGECYTCKYFEERKTPIKWISNADWEDYKTYYIAKLKKKEYKKFKNINIKKGELCYEVLFLGQWI